MLDIESAREIFHDAREELDSVIGPDIEPSEESEQIIEKFKQVISLLMAYPYVRPYIRCVMIDVGCNTIESTSEELEKMVQDKLDDDELDQNSICEITAKLGGALYAEVEKVILNNNFNLTDRTGSNEGWSIGCDCTMMEAEVLSSLLHCKFASAINNGIMSITWLYCTPSWKE